MKLAAAFRILSAYRQARRLDVVRDRGIIERKQAQWLLKLTKYIGTNSPFYRSYANRPFKDWPVIDKAIWMTRFDEVNTVGASLTTVAAIATRAEQTRNFSQMWNGITVGLSTGTSGSRGIFLVSAQERADWAGTLLGRFLRGSLFARERIALVFRSGSPLYDAVGALRISFRFFDQAEPWSKTLASLDAFQPTMLVAPARILRLLADSNSSSSLKPRRIVSVAEVLDDLDRARIEAAFRVPVEQIYQATEGFLGISCEQGAVHLNEPYVFVEPEWQDAAHTRFVPVITDLWRRTQPVIRYRLNDVLRVRPTPCPCGRAALALEAIEGRLDDLLWLPGSQAPVAVFPDLITRAIVTTLPELADYEVVEVGPAHWRVALRPRPSVERERLLDSQLRALAARLGATAPTLEFAALGAGESSGKQRRVRHREAMSCGS